jgi:RNA polymerase-binding transcription factor DksA
MTSDHITVLQIELDQVRGQIAALELATTTKPDYGLGVGDPAVTQWEMDRTLLEQLRERAETLTRAISGCKDGAYGICERCGEPIHPDRLAVLPETTLCIDCARSGQRT